MVTKLIKSYIFDIRFWLEKRKARRKADLYGKKYLVLVFEGKPVAVSMQGIKSLIRQKRFKKGFTAETAVKLAIYIAFPHSKNSKGNVSDC